MIRMQALGIQFFFPSIEFCITLDPAGMKRRKEKKQKRRKTEEEKSLQYAQIFARNGDSPPPPRVLPGSPFFFPVRRAGAMALHRQSQILVGVC